MFFLLTLAFRGQSPQLFRDPRLRKRKIGRRANFASIFSTRRSWRPALRILRLMETRREFSWRLRWTFLWPLKHRTLASLCWRINVASCFVFGLAGAPRRQPCWRRCKCRHPLVQNKHTKLGTAIGGPPAPPVCAKVRIIVRRIFRVCPKVLHGETGANRQVGLERFLHFKNRHGPHRSRSSRAFVV